MIRKHKDILKYQQMFPEIDIFDLHCINLRLVGIKLKGEGRKYARGRTGIHFNLYGQRLEQIFIPTWINYSSPYCFDGYDITFLDKPIYEEEDRVFKALYSPPPRIPREQRERYYFRRIRRSDGTINDYGILDINPEDRCTSKCIFCVRSFMCQSNKQQDKKRATDEENITHILEGAMQSKGLTSLRKVDQISLVTGEFPSEKYAIDAIKLLREVSSRYDFRGNIFYAGDQLTSEAGFEEVSELGVCLGYTIECFKNRNNVMVGPKGKANIYNIRDTLMIAREYLKDVSYFYILGIDSYSDFQTGIEMLRFYSPPTVCQIQIYLPEQFVFLHYETAQLTYFLKSARYLLDTFYHGKPPRESPFFSILWSPRRGWPMFHPTENNMELAHVHER